MQQKMHVLSFTWGVKSWYYVQAQVQAEVAKKATQRRELEEENRIRSDLLVSKTSSAW